MKAIAACDLATALDEKSVKAWFRRGQACLALGQVDAARMLTLTPNPKPSPKPKPKPNPKPNPSQVDAARKDLTRACQLAPSSREIRDELDKCKRVGAPKFI